MKKLFLSLLLIGIILVPYETYGQDGHQGVGAYLEATVQPSKKELRKRKKQMATEHEIDLLIISHDFRFEPTHIYSSKPELSDTVLITMVHKERKAAREVPIIRPVGGSLPRRIVLAGDDYIRIKRGWFEPKLIHEWMPLSQSSLYSSLNRNRIKSRQDQDQQDLDQAALPPPVDPPYTDAFRFTETVKEKDKTWFMTTEVDRFNETLKYEFVVQSSDWTVLRCTSNRWGGQIVYTGWLVQSW